MEDTMTLDLERAVRIPVQHTAIEGNLRVPANAVAVVTFAHGSGSSRHSARNQFVAGVLARSGIATLLVDLLTADEEQAERFTRHHRFDIQLLAQRLVVASQWLSEQAIARGLRQGYFGASTGAAAALVAAAQRPGI